MNYILIPIIFSSIGLINCANVEVSIDGPGVLDLPITFSAKLVGDVSLSMAADRFWYEFEDRGIYPRHREEVVTGRDANFTTTYSQVSVGEYIMRVQVYVDVFSWKGWLIADTEYKFKLQNSLVINVTLIQSGTSDEALSNSLVAANRTVELSAQIIGHSNFLKNSSTSYRWILDSRTFGPNSSPDLNYTFPMNKSYDLELMVISNISLPESNVTKVGKKTLQINAKNEIKYMNVTGNTWLQDGALLELRVNCSGGDGPFKYCYEFSQKKRENFSCDAKKLWRNECYFPITRYFPKNGTYYIDIAVFNDLNFKHKTITVIVYDIVRKTQLIFVIIPIMSSILAIIIVVVGIAYHLQQRQRLNETLEVADFDFQNNDNLIVKTFFERLRESLATGLRETFTYTCNPCTRPNNYDDLIDDTLPDEIIGINNRTENENRVTNGIVK